MNATKILRDEHGGIKIMLRVLERLANELEQGRDVSLDHLGQIIDFLRAFADRCHHSKEEDILFPALGEAGLPTEGGPIGVMLREHTQGRAFVRGMDNALERLRAGQNAGQEFADNALGYVELLFAHIDKEDNVLYVMAERALPAGADERLCAQYEVVEREKIGEGTHERYHALIRELAELYLEQSA